MFTTKTARIAAIVASAGVVLFGANAAMASPTAAPVQTAAISKPIVTTIRATAVKKIGGSFVANRTPLGAFRLPAGTWLITTNATFNRTVAAQSTATKTRPQLALRYGGGDRCAPEVDCSARSAGTIAGVDISPAVGRELMGAAVQTITITAPASVMVYGFGYNDDNTQVDSPGITVAAQITATRIG